MIFRRGSAPDPTGGAHDAPPDPLVGWGEGYPLPIPHPPRRLRRLDPRCLEFGPPTFQIKVTPLYTVSIKNIPDVCSYNSRKHCRIFIIFGRNIAKKASNQTMLYFSTSPN